MTTYSLSSYQQVAERLTALEKWLSKMGIRVAPTRIGHYQRLIDRLIKAHAAGSIPQVFTREQISSIILTFGEISEIEFVREHLSDGPNFRLREKLLDVVGGPVFPSDEDPTKSSNHARNILFELSIAATLVSGGFPLQPSGDCDLCTTCGENRVMIECKRPQSAKNVERVIKDGMSQLRKHLGRKPDRCFGLLAISASKVISGGTHVIRAPDKEGIQSELLSAGDKFIRSHGVSWNLRAPKGVIAVILHLGATGIAEDPGQLYTGKQYMVCPIERQSEEKITLARRFFEQFKNGSIDRASV